MSKDVHDASSAWSGASSTAHRRRGTGNALPSLPHSPQCTLNHAVRIHVIWTDCWSHGHAYPVMRCNNQHVAILW